MPADPSAPLLVDVHSHIYPPAFVEHLRRRGTPPFLVSVDGVERFQLFPGDVGVEFTADFHDVDAKIRYMDSSGIRHSVLSVGNPWLDLDAGEESVALAVAINDDLLELVARRPDRLSAMCLLPNHDVAGVVRCVQDLAADGRAAGVVTGTTICGLDLDDPALEPVWLALAGADMPVLVHPLSGLASNIVRGQGQALTLALSFPFETTVAIARMLVSSVLRRHPGLRVIASHGGGALPYLYGRLARAVEVDDSSDERARGLVNNRPPDTLYTDSILFSPAALESCLAVVGHRNVVFGTDHPFPIADAVSSLQDIRALLTDRPDRLADVMANNAIRLFGLEPASWADG
jgi:predicted TIM-barrel fold metal-dependent hydrolase